MAKKYKTHTEKYNAMLDEIDRLQEMDAISSIAIVASFLGSIASSLATIADIMERNDGKENENDMQ